MNPKKFLIEPKRRNISESRDRKRARDAYQHLTQNPDLHVINKHGNTLWIANLFRRLRYVQSEDAFHIDAENAC